VASGAGGRRTHRSVHGWYRNNDSDAIAERATLSGTVGQYRRYILTIKMSGPYAGPTRGPVDTPTTDVIQGTLDMLILKTLSLEPMHGFGIARRVEQISRGVFKVNPGSLLTALKRLERAGWLDSEWKETENSRRAKIYTLTRAGRKQLELETADWARRSGAIARLLKAEG
jgi:PadR family transcriptional regulator